MSNLIGRRYAKALFDAAQEGKALDKVEASVNDLIAALDESSELGDFFASPLLARAQQADAVAAIAKKAKFNDIFTNTLMVMAQKRRLAVVPAMLAAFKGLVDAERGEASAEVTTAVAMTKKQRDALSASLKKKVGKDVTIVETVDPSILGGIIVKLGSTLIDSSVKGKLSKLQTAMKEVG